MKAIDINGRFLTQATTGVQRAALELVRALDRRLAATPVLRDRYSFRLITPARHAREIDLPHIPVLPVGHLRGHAWEQLELPAHSHGRLLLNLCNTAPLIGRTLVTIHDASVFAVPEAYSWVFRAWYRTLLPMIGRRALRVVTGSRFSRDELSQQAGIPPEKVDVVPLGAEHILEKPADPDILARIPVEPGRYILAVGSRSPHKNIGAITRAVSQVGAQALPLVVAGGANPRVFGRAADDGQALHPAGYVTDGELRALYENAMCLVYPSLYEGFGLPPLEAMLCGCPVVVANAASLPEVCGEAALYCDPRDPTDIAGKIRTLIGESALRDELRCRGLERARNFTWQRASEALLEVIDQVQQA